MGMRFPRPLKGWRTFAGEVGTILVGVLLALGAQEAVQSLHWKSEVGQTREALDAEVARDVAAFNYRYDQKGCVADRLAELTRWSQSLGDGRPTKLKHPVDGPPFFKLRTAAWEVTDGEIAARIPVDARLSYAGMYDAMRGVREMQDDESEAWATIDEYEDAQRLDEGDARAVRRALKEIGDVNLSIGPFKSSIDRFARQLGVRPEADLERNAGPMIAKLRTDFCRPLL